ncbi:AzlD domain-containing protein [Caenimonas sp. SL110]|uniref:AzlD domain-containing protein n=1 Tax=Caenimonas sp. SL110 TaxID=1450524 RepID=UPI00065389C7|nr:AzlD domain-containing protein [Caenimonas sp. SL110]
MTPVEIFFTSIGMGLVALFCRAFFLMPEGELPMPRWLREGLRYAPTAALAAVVAPELFMTQGQLIHSVLDARLVGAVAGLAFYLWKRSLFWTIVVGTGAMLAARAWLGW